VNEQFLAEITAALAAIVEQGSYKSPPTLVSPQSAAVRLVDGAEVLVFCSNDYLGLASDADVVAAGIDGLRRYGAGTASVRFVCGTFIPHVELEAELANLQATEAALTYSSCWSANLAALTTVVDDSTTVLSDALNHASLIDGIRQSRAGRKVVYPHSDMAALAELLSDCSRTPGRILIVTDGVFSMEGDLAPLADLLELAERFDAVVLMDDSHGTGVLGREGRGTAEHFGVLGEVDIVTGTLGKALGGAAGGFVAARRPVVDLLFQSSRPQIFSNPIPPSVACSAQQAIRTLRARPELLRRLRDNVKVFRDGLAERGLDSLPGESAIIPVVLYDEKLAERLSHRLLEEGILVTAFRYPVVPTGEARIRVQITARHTRDDLHRTLDTIARCAKEVQAR
jgi:glycine C-acetyltransferase